MNMDIGKRIKLARKLSDMNQHDLASATGLSQQAISAIESGRNKTTASILTIASVLGVRAEWLEKGIEPMHDDNPLSSRNQIIEALMRLPPQERILVASDVLARTAGEQK